MYRPGVQTRCTDQVYRPGVQTRCTDQVYRPGVQTRCTDQVYRPGVIRTTINNVVIQSSNVSRERVCESIVPITEAAFPRCTGTDSLCSK